MKEYLLNSLLNEGDFKINKFEIYSFYFGLFLLPSAFSIAILFLFISGLSSLIRNKKKLLSDKWNIIFLIGCLMMLVSSIFHLLNNRLNSTLNWDASLSLIGLANWWPLIILFIGSQPYLINSESRKNAGLILLSGTFPVLISGIGQAFFNWTGPIELLNGLIIWYQRPTSNFYAITGLFNNPNYAGAWLNIIWPFSLITISKCNGIFKKLFCLIFMMTTFVFIILTGSRSALLGVIISIPLVFGKSCFKWFLPSILFLFTFLASILFPIFGENSKQFLQTFIPEIFWLDFTSMGYVGLDTTRLKIWEVAIKSIINQPLIGNGAASFSYIFESQTGIWKGHTHSLPFEIAVSYGIPAALLILIPIIFFSLNALKKLNFKRYKLSKENLFERAWITSLIILLMSQMVDIQYFDGRISIAGWLLLSGTRNILRK